MAGSHRRWAVQKGQLYVSRFRSAELLTLDASGAITSRQRPQTELDLKGGPAAQPGVAWRTIGVSSGAAAGVLMLHQRASAHVIDDTHPGGYGAGMCKGNGISSTTTSVFAGGAVNLPQDLMGSAMMVDVAVSPDGSRVVMARTGQHNGNGFAQVSEIADADAARSGNPMNGCGNPRREHVCPGDVTAVAFAPDGTLLAQSREPAGLYVLGDSTATPIGDFSKAPSVASAAHALFHTPTAGFIACASCHPEAGDDGQVWNFADTGPRRTLSLRGGLKGTEPFHWNGDLADIGHLMNTVFIGRMSGIAVTPADTAALLDWMDGQPALARPPVSDAASVARGQALFADAQVGCLTCHAGAQGTNNQNADVGTGGSFQVPRLVGLAERAPYLHAGCAGTLADRFGACGGTMHGTTAQLSPAQIADLISYLQTR